MDSLCSYYLYSVFPFSPVPASGTGLVVVYSSSIAKEDGLDEGFPEMENFQHIIDLKSYEKS